MTKNILKTGLSLLTVLGLQLSAIAQDKIEVSKQDVSSWFAQNWMWVVAGVVLLIIIVLAGGSRSRRKTTTVVKDDYGNVRSVTTTEVKE